MENSTYAIYVLYQDRDITACFTTRQKDAVDAWSWAWNIIKDNPNESYITDIKRID